jgi:hypothetical protein
MFVCIHVCRYAFRRPAFVPLYAQTCEIFSFVAAILQAYRLSLCCTHVQVIKRSFGKLVLLRKPKIWGGLSCAGEGVGMEEKGAEKEKKKLFSTSSFNMPKMPSMKDMKMPVTRLLDLAYTYCIILTGMTGTDARRNTQDN